MQRGGGWYALGLLAGVWVGVSCGGGGGKPAEGLEPVLLVEGGWVRTRALPEDAPAAGVNSAAYFRLRNVGRVGDRLVGGRTPLAESVEIHETREEEGVMRMRAVEAVEVPPAGEVEFRPGGLHLMLVGLRRSLSEGDSVPLILVFQGRGEVEVRLPVGGTGSQGGPPGP